MKKRLISIFILIAYSAILIKVMVFKDLPIIRIGPLMFNFGGTHEGPANLVPLKTILPYLLGKKGLVIAFINIAGNIVLLVPIGFLVRFVYRNMVWKKALALAVAAGLSIEGMQLVFHVGIFDIDDVILNGLGVMIGYWAFPVAAKMLRSMKSKNIIITAVIVIVVAAAVAFYFFAGYGKTHLPVRSGQNGYTTRVDSGEVTTPEDDDPCNGTGGTGQIISAGNNSITIKRHDGVNEIINLTNQTTIRTSAGAASQSDLKTGVRVTVVVESNHTATIILICNAAGLAK